MISLNNFTVYVFFWVDAKFRLSYLGDAITIFRGHFDPRLDFSDLESVAKVQLTNIHYFMNIRDRYARNAYQLHQLLH